MSGDELARLVTGVFGAHATHVQVDTGRVVLTCMLYEVFPVRVGLDGEYGTFAGGILISREQSYGGVKISPDLYLSTLLGQTLSLNDDPVSIRANLHLIDQYCRLRLPDEFLNAQPT